MTDHDFDAKMRRSRGDVRLQRALIRHLLADLGCVMV